MGLVFCDCGFHSVCPVMEEDRGFLIRGTGCVGNWVLGDLSNPGRESKSPALQADALPAEPPGKHPYSQSYGFSNSIDVRVGP